MTFQPTAWVLVFATLFVGFFEQGCSPGGGGGTAAATTEGQDGDGGDVTRNRNGDGDDGPDNEPKPAPEHDDRTNREKVGKWITGNLLEPGSEDTLQTMVGNVSQVQCATECIQWCLCTACVWKENICQLSTADIVNVEEVNTGEDNAEEEVAGPEEETVANKSRRMLQYGQAPTTTTPEPPQHVWLKARCGEGIRGTLVAALKEAGPNKTKSGNDEQTVEQCGATCERPNGCNAWQARPATVHEPTSSVYGPTQKKITLCHHVGDEGAYLTQSEGGASNNTEPGSLGDDEEVATSGTTCPPQAECTADFVKDFAFVDLYSDENYKANSVASKKDCKDKCSDKNKTICGVTFVELQKGGFWCFTTDVDTQLVNITADGEPIPNATYYGFIKTGPQFRPKTNTESRSSTSDAPAVGAIIGGALAAVAVAVLAFVGFRAYKKHKGADAENAAETGSVATSSPKSARKRQAIE